MVRKGKKWMGSRDGVDGGVGMELWWKAWEGNIFFGGNGDELRNIGKKKKRKKKDVYEKEERNERKKRRKKKNVRLNVKKRRKKKFFVSSTFPPK